MSISQYAYDFAYPTATERTAVVLNSSHVGKVARQLDDNSYWFVSPFLGPDPVWSRMPDQLFDYDPNTGILTHVISGLKISVVDGGDRVLLDLPSELLLKVAGAVRFGLRNRLYLYNPNDYGTGEIERDLVLQGPEESTTPGVAGDGRCLRFNSNADDGGVYTIGEVFVSLVNPSASALSSKMTFSANGSDGEATLVFDGSDLSLKIYNNGTLVREVSTATTFTTGTIPTADATWRGKIISIKDPAADEIFQICRQKADNSYEWKTLTLA